MPRVYVALGGNLPWRGAPAATTILSAMNRLQTLGQIQASSGLWSSPAWPDPVSPRYVNALVRMETSMEVDEFLRALFELEDAFGRRRGKQWGDRTLDLDLVASDDVCRHDADGFLILPHPRAHERAFVLKPLRDVAPLWRHPRLRVSVTELLAQLPQQTCAQTHLLTKHTSFTEHS